MLLLTDKNSLLLKDEQKSGVERNRLHAVNTYRVIVEWMEGYEEDLGFFCFFR